MGAVIWLASYPKSGNTWTRALLAGHDEAGALDLNRIGHAGHPGGIRGLDDLIGVNPTMLRMDEIDRYKPDAARAFARDTADWAGVVYCKIHSANVATASGDRFFPADAGRAVYIVRNPLDVATSTAPFFGLDIDKAIARMADSDFVLNPWRRSHTYIAPEPMGSWSDHVLSWLDAPGLDLHVVRYEDLHADTAGTFAAVLDFVGVDTEPARIQAAVEAARFERLREKESAEGFWEHNMGRATAPFFRKGKTGSWREELTAEQARRVVADHEAVMRRLGYGDAIDEVAALPTE